MKKCIAYLAPEIPALSATFVYNEILLLQERGYRVVPISIHVPFSRAEDTRLARLKKQIYYLYKEGGFIFLLANIISLYRSPGRYVHCIYTVFQDIFRVGLWGRTGCGLFFRFFSASRVAQILEKEQCEHIHAHFAHIPTDIAMYASIISDLPFSFTAHANDLFERGWLLAEKVGRAKFTATISAYNRDFIVSQGGERSKIHIVRCGVDSRMFSIVDKIDDVNISYKIGTIGRMVEKKGFDVLIQAAVILKKNGIDFNLSIAGGGPLANDLKTLAKSACLDTFVVFNGPIAHGDVPAWLATLDLFVLPCQCDSNGDMDGIPVVLMEAMLSGIPVVSTAISGIPELISDGHNGLLVSPKSPQKLASAIENILVNEKLRMQCCINALDRVKSEFDANINIKRLIREFER